MWARCNVPIGCSPSLTRQPVGGQAVFPGAVRCRTGAARSPVGVGRRGGRLLGHRSGAQDRKRSGRGKKRRHAAARTGTVVEEEQDVCSPQKDGARRMPDTEEKSTVLRRAPPYGAVPLRPPERGPSSLKGYPRFISSISPLSVWA